MYFVMISIPSKEWKETETKLLLFLSKKVATSSITMPTNNINTIIKNNNKTFSECSTFQNLTQRFISKDTHNK